ncbi:MAG: MaoC family dehydratase [Acidimicrobiia bacterium]|nr:MaoC family dehydratase [Acidimicrobiia bacterium]
MHANPTVDYLDDFAAGQVFDLGTFSLTEDEIIEFATRYDPQAFHVDPEAAAESVFGGLIASGWQTVASVMRLLVDNLIPAKSALGSPGIDELRWLKPVRPGVEHRATYEVLEVRESRSKPDRGLIRARCITVDPDGEPVMSFVGVGMYLKRP